MTLYESVHSEPSSLELASQIARLAEDKKAEHILILETDHISSIADYFVICSGQSKAQIKAIANSIKATVKSDFERIPFGEEKDQENHWVLMDYSDVVLHIMHPQERDYYQLESFWSHSDRIPRHHWSASRVS